MKNSRFKDKYIFVGIDQHKRSWDFQVLTENANQKPVHLSDPSPEFILNYLDQHYPDGIYRCAYEAGFSGFWLQEELEQLGVNTIVVHPADIPTTDKDKRFKNDRRDCRKIALSLRAGQLTGIHIPSKQRQMDRAIVRQRYRFASDVRRSKNRITSHLDFFGLMRDQKERDKYWSNRYIKQLEQQAEQIGDIALQGFLEKLRADRELELKALRKLRALSLTEKYADDVKLLNTIPGVGLLTSMVWLTEMGDLSRFKRDDHLMSYIGLVPGLRSSGEREIKTRLTRRGNKYVRTALILSAWVAIRNCPNLSSQFENYKKRMGSNKAIIRIARKLALIMKSILKSRQPYRI